MLFEIITILALQRDVMGCCVLDSAVSVLSADQTARVMQSSDCNIVHFLLRFSETFRYSLSVSFLRIERLFL